MNEALLGFRSAVGGAETMKIKQVCVNDSTGWIPDRESFLGATGQHECQDCSRN